MNAETGETEREKKCSVKCVSHARSPDWSDAYYSLLNNKSLSAIVFSSEISFDK